MNLILFFILSQSANFGNPVYESMYNAGNSMNEEKKGLLQGETVVEKHHPLASSRETL